MFDKHDLFQPVAVVLGKLLEPLHQGGSAKVARMGRLDGRWQYLESTPFVAVDWSLNKGESVQAGTKVRLEWYRGEWVVTATCPSVDDTEAESK